MKAFISFLKDMSREFWFVFDNLSKYIANLIIFITPYLMFWFGAMLSDYSFIEACKELWFVLLLPVVMIIVSSFIKYYANMIGKGDVCPIPYERFTEYDEDSGMVSVRNDRVQEMILYVEDVEEYLERKGYL